MVYNATEIFEIAIQIERNGADFYRNMSARVEKQALKDELLHLSDMEKSHVVTFEELKRRVSDMVSETSMTIDPNHEALRYLQTLAGAHIFKTKGDPMTALTGQPSVKDILTYAIDREKESVLFYVGIKELVPPDLGREQIEQIIREEMSHIVLLSDSLSFYEKRK